MYCILRSGLSGKTDKFPCYTLDIVISVILFGKVEITMFSSVAMDFHSCLSTYNFVLIFPTSDNPLGWNSDTKCLVCT